MVHENMVSISDYFTFCIPESCCGGEKETTKIESLRIRCGTPDETTERIHPLPTPSQDTLSFIYSLTPRQNFIKTEPLSVLRSSEKLRAPQFAEPKTYPIYFHNPYDTPDIKRMRKAHMNYFQSDIQTDEFTWTEDELDLFQDTSSNKSTLQKTLKSITSKVSSMRSVGMLQQIVRAKVTRSKIPENLYKNKTY